MSTDAVSSWFDGNAAWVVPVTIGLAVMSIPFYEWMADRLGRNADRSERP